MKSKYVYKYSFLFDSAGVILRFVEMNHAGQKVEGDEELWINHKLAYDNGANGSTWVRVGLTEEEVEVLRENK